MCMQGYVSIGASSMELERGLGYGVGLGHKADLHTQGPTP